MSIGLLFLMLFVAFIIAFVIQVNAPTKVKKPRVVSSNDIHRSVGGMDDDVEVSETERFDTLDELLESQGINVHRGTRSLTDDLSFDTDWDDDSDYEIEELDWDGPHVLSLVSDTEPYATHDLKELIEIDHKIAESVKPNWDVFDRVEEGFKEGTFYDLANMKPYDSHTSQSNDNMTLHTNMELSATHDSFTTPSESSCEPCVACDSPSNDLVGSDDSYDDGE